MVAARSCRNLRRNVMDNNIKKLVDSMKTFAPQMLEPPYSGIPTFFGTPYLPEITDQDIALAGVPFDLGVTNRSGARLGPQEIRNQSRLVGVYNHYSHMSPLPLIEWRMWETCPFIPPTIWKKPTRILNCSTGNCPPPGSLP